MSCGVGHRHSSNPELLWLWQRPAATALIRLLAWEPPHAVGEALENAEKKQKKKKTKGTLMKWDFFKESNLNSLTFRLDLAA